MKTYKVIKPFFKQSEQKNYFVDDTIELTKEESEVMFEYVVEIKEKSKK